MMLRTLAAATAAALLLLGATRGAPLLAWLVCAPLVAASLQPGVGIAAATVLGAVFALEVALAAHAAWLAEAAQGYFLLSPAGGVAAALVLCIACAVPLGALLGLGLRCAAALPRGWPILASASLWVTWEALTRMVFPYYPWIGLAVTQTNVPTVLQMASLAGQGGLSLALATSGSALGYALHGTLAGATDRDRRARWWPIALAAMLAIAVHLHGTMRLHAASAAVAAPICSLAAVDARITDPSVPREEVLARYAATSVRAAAARPDAIVWPESALPADPLLDGPLLHRLRSIAHERAAVLLAGGPRTEWDERWRPRLYNSVFRIAGDEAVQVYDKREPVPFAEAWPRRFIARPAWLESEDVAAGRSAEPMRAGGCRLGILVCFEVERPALAFAYAAADVDALVVLSNDAQLPARAGRTEIAESRLRAVETGLPVLRAANLGESVAIDRYGHVTEGVDGIVSLPVAAAEPAPAVRWARPLLAFCWLTAAATMIAGLHRARRPR